MGNDTNQLRLIGVAESTVGTTPASPRMRALRLTGDNLRAEAGYTDSEEIRPDRMDADRIKVSEMSDGTVSMEWHYPPDRSLLSELIKSAFFNNWVRTPSHDNDGTAGVSISQLAAVAGTISVVDESGSGGFSGTAYKAGHLVRTTGFAASANNILAKVASSTATLVTFGTTIFPTTDNAPGAAVRMKVVGFEGAAGDIRATATGLASTTLDFTTLGLQVGQWVKVGGSVSPYRFATAASNGKARITAIAANALTLDNLPPGWAADTGSSKTIRVFVGDFIRNGTTTQGISLERGWMGQQAPTYILQPGMVASQFEWTLTARQKMTATVTFLGMGYVPPSNASVDAVPDAAPAISDYPFFAAGPNVGRVAEAGSSLAAPNFVRSMTITLNNNTREVEDVRSAGAVGIGAGNAAVTVVADTIFGDLTLLTKAHAGTPTSLNTWAQKGTQAVVWTVPRATPSGSPNNPARNQDATLSVTFTASMDPLTSCHLQMDRFDYVEA